MLIVSRYFKSPAKVRISENITKQKTQFFNVPVLFSVEIIHLFVIALIIADLIFIFILTSPRHQAIKRLILRMLHGWRYGDVNFDNVTFLACNMGDYI